MMIDPIYQLLAWCARTSVSDAQKTLIAEAASALPDWSSVPARAEVHHLAPLLYTQLQAAHVAPPMPVWRELQGLYLRHRRANEIRSAVLYDVLKLFAASDISVLVLKGAALSHFLYPEPGLRPMSDLDLLVPPAEVFRAQQTLAPLGFQVPLTTSRLTHRHLAAAYLMQEGVKIEVEIHQRLMSDYFDNARAYVQHTIGRRSSIGAEANRLAKLSVPPYAFDLNGFTAYSLGLEDQLRHLCQHLISHVNAWDYARLIWVADVISLADRFVHEIDWDRVRRQSPQVLNTLAVLHWMTPLSDNVIKTARLKIHDCPEGLGFEFNGWPRGHASDYRQIGRRKLLRQTFIPSEWWLRLRYASGKDRPLIWYRIRHALYIAGQAGRVTLEKLGWPTAAELVSDSPSSEEQR